jgi:hypothetical protein
MDFIVFVLEDILEAFNRWKFRDPLPEDAHKKVRKLIEPLYPWHYC